MAKTHLEGRDLQNVCFTHVYYPPKNAPPKSNILYETLVILTGHLTAVHIPFQCMGSTVAKSML